MFRARFQADAPVEVAIREEVGYLEIPSAAEVLHVGMSVCNLRLLARSVADALNEHDTQARNVIGFRKRSG